MQTLLRAIEARKAEVKTAAAAISFLEEEGHLVDTGRTKKPQRSADRIARAERLQKRGLIAKEGGRRRSRLRTIPTDGVSFWIRLGEFGEIKRRGV
jgi:hypothetical protein